MTRLKRMPSPAAERLADASEKARRIPRVRRLLEALVSARDEPIGLQVKGGRGFGRDLRELVSRGYLRMRSQRYYGVHPSTNPSYSEHRLSTAVLVITEKDLAAAARGGL